MFLSFCFRSLIAACLIFGVAGSAEAANTAWTLSRDSTAASTATTQLYQFSFIPATMTQSAGIDTSRCSSLQRSWDPSTGNAATNAKAEWLMCPTASSLPAACDSIPSETLSGDGKLTAFSVASEKHFLVLLPLVAPATGDVALARVACVLSGTTGQALRQATQSSVGLPRRDTIIDTTPIFAPFINDGWDADASTYSMSFFLADAVDDRVLSDATDTLCTNAACEMTLETPSSANSTTLNLPSQFRRAVCRDGAGYPFSPCEGPSPGTCVSTLGATAFIAMIPITIWDVSLDEYVTYGISAATTANCLATGNFPVTITPALAKATTTSDHVSMFLNGGIHYSTYGSRAIGEFVANATVESTYIPIGNEILGLPPGSGTMEQNCALSGWVASGGPSVAQTTPGSTEYGSWKLRSAIWGNGCVLTGTVDANVDFLTSPAIPTVSNAMYVARFFARTNEGTGMGIKVDILDNATPIAQYIWDWTYGSTIEAASTPGWHGIPHGANVGCQTADRNGTWQLCIIKFMATSAVSKIRIGSLAAATSVWIDEVYVFPAENGLFASLDPYLQNGPVSVTLDGDSQVHPGQGLLGESLYRALSKRPQVSLSCTAEKCTRGHNGARLLDTVNSAMDIVSLTTYGHQAFRRERPEVAIFNTGINDLYIGYSWGNAEGIKPHSPNLLSAKAAYRNAFQAIGQYAERVAWIVPGPWAYATAPAVVTCGLYECGVANNKVVASIIHDQLNPTSYVTQQVWFPAATCNNVTAVLQMDTPATNPATAACNTGSNGVTKGVLSFDPTTANSAQTTYRLPADWFGLIDFSFKWMNAAAGSVLPVAWCAQVVCVADGEDDGTTGATFPATAIGNCVSDPAKTTAYLANEAELRDVTATTCAAGETAHIKISRDPAEVSTRTDTNATAALLLGVEMTMRRAN